MNDPNEMITTIHGPMEAKHLRRVNEVTDNERERTVVVKYFLGPQMVHRSVHIQLKQGLGIEGILGAI